jgi:hypothetical protein
MKREAREPYLILTAVDLPGGGQPILPGRWWSGRLTAPAAEEYRGCVGPTSLLR